MRNEKSFWLQAGRAPNLGAAVKQSLTALEKLVKLLDHSLMKI